MMTHHTWKRRTALLLTALALVCSACSATENVTLTEAGVASATSTAVRESVGAPPAAQTPDEDQADAANSSIRAGATGSGCVFTFVDSFGDIQIELAFTSPLQEQSDASVGYEVFDGNGNLIDASSKFLEDLMPDEQVRIQVDTLIDEPVDAAARSGISCVLRDIEPSPFGSTANRPGPGDTCRFVEVDSFDDIQIELRVENPFADTSEFVVDYVLRGSDGIRFGDGIAFLEGAPGESVTASEDTVTEFPEWASESNFSCEIVNLDGF